MKIKLDENLPATLVGILAILGHDADTVVDSLNDVSPVNDAVMLRLPNVAGVHVHDASPPITLVVPHAPMVFPFSMKRTVPVVLDGPVTVAVNV